MVDIAQQALMVRMVFRLANNKLARPKHWIEISGGHGTLGQRQDVAQAAYDAVVSSGLMAGFNEDTSFLRAEAQGYETFPSTGAPPAGPGNEYPYGGITPVTGTSDSTGAAVPGVLTTDGIPPQGSLVFSTSSDHPGPSGRGRSYYPPPGEVDTNSDGTVAQARIDQIYADLGTVLTAIVGATVPGGVIGILSARDDAFYDFTGTGITALVRTQRRRATRSL